VLIKACAQAIPIFAMSCFDITKGLCDQMSAMVCRFWWAQQDEENKVHWISWDKLSLSKKVGGLGYKDLHSFNMAMLTKQGWRLLTDPTLLCARMLKAKYFPTTDVLHAERMGHTMALIWSHRPFVISKQDIAKIGIA
jgi:hypothetical protein